MTFTFNSAPLSTLNSANTFYAQMVTTTPSISLTTAADISASSVSTVYVLTGTSYTAGILDFPDQTIPTKTYTSAHVGYVLLRRDGASPASTDPLICYVPHTNSFGSEITLPAETYAMPITFQAGGLLAVVDGYQYSMGNYVNNGAAYFNNGIVQLIGTENNTLSYTNPHSRTPKNIEVLAHGGGSGAALFDRNASVAIDPGKPSLMFRFRNNGDMRFNSGGLVAFTSSSIPSNSIRLWGSNSLAQGWTQAALTDNSNWTELVDFGIIATGGNRLSTTFSSPYYKFFRISTVNPATAYGSHYFGNIDMYNCTVRTPFVNFA
jgi:hypothetical protein